MDIPEKFSHCYARTLRIENEDSGSCSGFVLRYREHDWLVTARHVVTEIIVPGNGARIKLRDRSFTVFDKEDNPHSDSELVKLDMVDFRADVTVFRLWSSDIEFGPPLLPVGDNEARATEDVYFLGFPGFDLPPAYGLTPQPTTPLIKRAMLSGKANHYDIEVWLLDGMANHGFSGGPVVILDPKSKSYHVFGVLTGHAPANIRVNPALSWSTANVPSALARVGGIVARNGYRRMHDEMRSTKGINVAGDVLVNETADGVNLNAIWREISTALDVYNNHRSTIVRLLSYPTLAVADVIPQSVEGESFEIATEMGVPTALREPADSLRLG